MALAKSPSFCSSNLKSKVVLEITMPLNDSELETLKVIINRVKHRWELNNKHRWELNNSYISDVIWT